MNPAFDRESDNKVMDMKKEIENKDYEIKKLKSEFSLIEQEHKRETLKLQKKIESILKTREDSMNSLKKNMAKNGSEEKKKEEKQKLKEELTQAINEKKYIEETIRNLENSLPEKYMEENKQYELLNMFENDIYSTENEKSLMEKEVPVLEERMKTMFSTYPINFKKLSNDFQLFDHKQRLDTEIQELDKRIILLNNKIERTTKYLEEDKNSEKNKKYASSLYQVEIKLKQGLEDDIKEIESGLNYEVEPYLCIDKLFTIITNYFNEKNYNENNISNNSLLNTFQPIKDELLKAYNEDKENLTKSIFSIEKDINALLDSKPLGDDKKKKIEILKKENKANKDRLNILEKLIFRAKKLYDSYCTLGKSGTSDTNSIDQDFFKKLEEMIFLTSLNPNKEEAVGKVQDYLDLQEIRGKENFKEKSSKKSSEEEIEAVKRYSQMTEGTLNKRKGELEEYQKIRKRTQDQLKGINDTIKSRAKELKNSLSKKQKEEFDSYFSQNKDLMNILLNKEKKVIIVNNEYELTKNQVKENVLVDHSRKKVNIYTLLQKKHLLEYLVNLFREDNTDLVPLRQKIQQAYDEITTSIKNDLEEIDKKSQSLNEIKNKINNVQNIVNQLSPEEIAEQEIMAKTENEINEVNFLIEQENQKFLGKQREYQGRIDQLMEEIKALSEELGNKLNAMASGEKNLYLKKNPKMKNFSPLKDEFDTLVFGYCLRQFEFLPQEQILIIKSDKNNNLKEQKIPYDTIKKIILDQDSVKLVDDIEAKVYENEEEKQNDMNKWIKFFVNLRRGNLDIATNNYNDYKEFVDIINTIIVHK